MAAISGEAGSEKCLAESLRRFCRSIELCDDYLRGYYGLKLTTARLLTGGSQASRQVKSDSVLAAPDTKTVEHLNEIATAKLSEIVRVGGDGYALSEVISAKALLESESAKITR